MAEQKITDLSYLNDIAMGDKALITDMIELFLEGVPVSVEHLKSLIESKEWKRVAEIAHKLKPNLAYMGLNSAKDMLEQLEEDARKNENTENLFHQASQIEKICNQAYVELNEMLDELRM